MLGISFLLHSSPPFYMMINFMLDPMSFYNQIHIHSLPSSSYVSLNENRVIVFLILWTQHESVWIMN